MGFHQAQIGTSHFCSLIDILIGGLRYSVNNRNDPKKRDTALELISQIAPLCLRESISEKVNELSVFFSQKIIEVSKYLDTYKDLHSFFTEGGMEPAQVPSNIRTY